MLRVRPGTSVKLTLKDPTNFQGWNPGCEPTNALTCTIVVQDETTWVGARFGDDGPPGLPTTIDVQFHLRRGGTGSGRVSASDLDCGTVCTRQYGYGKSLTLTAAPDQGSVFSGWNGVCPKTQTTCTFPVGPVTSIKAVFDHDTTPPSSPDALTRHVTDTHRPPDHMGGREGQRRRHRLPGLPQRCDCRRHDEHDVLLRQSGLRSPVHDRRGCGRCGRQPVGPCVDHRVDPALRTCGATRGRGDRSRRRQAGGSWRSCA